jgi:hypothetical protein
MLGLRGGGRSGRDHQNLDKEAVVPVKAAAHGLRQVGQWLQGWHPRANLAWGLGGLQPPYRNALRWSEEEEGKKEEEEKRRKKEGKEEMSTLYPLPRLAVDHLQR